MRVIIQAGGIGSRLRPYTTVVPKPLMPVAEMPILEVVIRQLAMRGFDRITITVGHLAHLIRAFFGDGAAFGVHIDYLLEEEPLGTIGAVRMVTGLTDPFVVMNGDLLTDVDYGAFYRGHVASGVAMSVGVYNKEVPVSLGVIEFDADKRITGFEEKPVKTFPVSMGVYAMSPEMLEHIPRGEHFGFDDLMVKVIAEKIPVRAVEFDGIWLDIGRHEDYDDATRVFLANRHRFLGGAGQDNPQG